MGYYGHSIHKYPVLVANSSVLVNNLLILYKKLRMYKTQDKIERIEKITFTNL